MSNTARILFAALVLSSGACLSEAFSTASSFLVSQRNGVKGSSLLRSPTGALQYAQNSNLGNSRRPNKRRTTSRNKTTSGTSPKKPKINSRNKRARSSTVRTAASATGEAMTENTTVQERPDQPQKQRKQAAKKDEEVTKPLNLDGIHMTNEMLDHDLLSKQEEQLLCHQVRRSIQAKEAIQAWLQTEECANRFEEQLETEENWIGIYGTPVHQAMEQYFCEDTEESPADELFYRDGSHFEGDMPDLSEVYSLPRTQQQQRRRQKQHPDSWVEELFQNPSSKNQNLYWLTDEDVKTVLNLPGGRSQLRQILLEGALARKKLMESNIRLVSSIAIRWAKTQPNNGDFRAKIYKDFWSRPNYNDLVNEGVKGLAEAADRFDPDRGLRFTTYATFWITNSVRKHFQYESTAGMRLPIPNYDLKRKYINLVRLYLSKNKQPPPLSQMADELGVSENRLQTVLRLTQSMTSLDAPLAQGLNGAGKAGSYDVVDPGYTLSGMLASDEPLPEDYVERSFLRECLENAMATELSPNERDVIRMRLGLDDGVIRTANEVAALFSGQVKASDIRSVEKRAFKKLRSPYSVHTSKLMCYLDVAGADKATLRYY